MGKESDERIYNAAEEEEKVEKMRIRMDRMTEELRSEGYVLEVNGDHDEFVIKVVDSVTGKTREIHLSSKDPFPLLNHDNKLTPNVGIDEILRAEITHPGESIYDSVQAARAEQRRGDKQK